MAHVYVRSAAAGTGTGADWTNAYTTLAAALTAKAAGDNFWVSEDHAETQGSAMTLTSPGTSTAPCTVICVNHLGTVPPVSADLATTATITTTGNFGLTIAGNAAYYYGIAFNAGSGAVTANLIVRVASGVPMWAYFKNCKLAKLGTSASTSAILLGANQICAQRIILDNTTLQFGNTGDSLALRAANITWKNTASAIAGATIPTQLVKDNSDNPGVVMLDGVDLSAIAGGTIFGTNISPWLYMLKDCKLGASTVASTNVNIGSAETYVLRSDSGATNYRHEKYTYLGTQTVEIVIVRTGGASDGTTPIAWKIVTTANSKWILPFESLPIPIWNDTTAANRTISVYGIWGGGAVPNNDDIWIEVGYLGSALTPIATINTGNSKADYLAVAAGQTTDASVWGGSTTAFKMSVTLSSPQPAQKGSMYVVVKAGKASSTFYIDPKVVLS